MNAIHPQSLSDRDLLAETTRAVARERRATTELLALLAEVDARRLYLGEGCSSLFTYCTQVLRLSEPAAYSRITAARVARRIPAVLTGLAAGEITLSRFRDLAGVGRRDAQLLLERMDVDGLTRRIGDRRVLRRAARAGA